MQLRCESVGFRYGRRVALDGIDLSLDRGITGLLGPNGAGKSTLLSLLATVRQPSRGRVTLDGVDLHGPEQATVRRAIGYLPQRFDLMRWSTALRNVTYAAWAQGVPRDQCEQAAHDALALVDLTDEAGRRAGTLSGGQQQRLGIACSIAHRPNIVLLDEPTAGLDPAQRVQIREHLAAVAGSSIVLLSTHIVEDLALMASNVAVIHQGALVFHGAVRDMLSAGARTEGPDGISELESGYLSLVGGLPPANRA